MEYCFEISLAPHMDILPDAVADKLHAKVMKIFHGTSRRLGASQVGLSFPEWSVHGERPRLGRRVIVFSSDQAMLEKVNYQMDFEELELTGVINRSSIKIVPENAERATFTRSRVGDRCLRLISAGEGDEKILKEKIKQEKVPFIMIKKPGGSRFSLAIDRRAPAEGRSNFNSYGLSSIASAPVF